MQFSNTKIIDEKNQEFIREKNIILEASESALIHSSAIQRSLLNLSLDSKVEDPSIIKKNLLKATINNEIDMFTILRTSSSNFNFKDSLLAKMKKTNSVYKANCITFIRLLKNNDREIAARYRIDSLRPALGLYQELQKKLLLQITSESANESNRINSYKSISGWGLFIVGTFPYLFILYFLGNMILKRSGCSYCF